MANNSRPSTAGTLQEKGKAKSGKSFFGRSKSTKSTERTEPNDSVDEKDGKSSTSNEEPLAPVIPVGKEVEPVSFAQLFRFTTRKELFYNFVGLITAAASGAAQPLMSLLFGNLTQDFVVFQTLIAQAEAGNSDAAANIPAAAAHFLHSSGQNASYLVYIGLGMMICVYIYMVGWVYTGEINAKRIRESYLKATLRQDIAYFDNVGAGEIATRIQTDTHLVQQGTSEKVALVVSFLAAFVTGLLSLKYVAEGGTVAEEVISTVRTAQAFGTQKILSGLYDVHNYRAEEVDLKAAIAHGCGLSVFFFVIYSAYALAFDFGTTLIGRGQADAGIVVNVFFAILIGSFSLALLAPEMQAITHARGAAAKLYSTIDRHEGLQPATVHGEIVLEGVQFSYPSRPTVPVVKGVNLHFQAGKTAALVGASGSGKSTAISLIERFYDPTAGVVKLDGVNLKDINIKWLRSQIGLVSQEPTLFATSIKNNVAHGLINTPHEHASEAEKFALIKQACIKANADGFITKLPQGYDTMVGERAMLLSGGQKQRIAIARAIVSDPRILLLDEATSALDTQSEGIVQDALDKASQGRTTITIAHRLSTIKDADQIFVMGDGLVIEQGTHNELLEKEGAYARLVQAQKIREVAEAKLGDDADAVDVDNAVPEDMEKAAAEEIPLGRQQSGRSVASEILEKRAADKAGKKSKYSVTQLFRRMGAVNSDSYKLYVIGFIAAIATGAVYPAFGIVFSQAIGGFSLTDWHAMRHAGDRNALWFFLIAICSTISIGTQNYAFAASASKLSARLRSLSFKAILRQDVEFFDEESHSTGSLVSNLSDNPQKVNGLAGVTLGAIVQSASTLIVGFIIGTIYAYQVGLVGFACTPLLISTGYIRLRVVVLKDQANKAAHEESAQLACEAAGAIRTVASLTREADCLDMYSKSLEEPLRQSNRTAVWSNMLYACSQSMSFYVIALVFWWGAKLVSQQRISTTDFFVGLMSTTFGAIQAGNVFSFVPDVSSAKGSAEDILELLDSKPEIDADSTEGTKISRETIRGHIKFENVHFRYPTRPGIRVLRDLTLDIEPGMYVALVGASGCGKSTTIQLIERFYDPLSGNVYLDGEKISDLNVAEYRKQIALVSQEPTLYAGTVRFNILLGAIKPESEVTQEEIEEACRKANILEFIQSLPNGFDTEVGGKGGQLSGGQKQRIAIARALLRNPKVLLLDEATSALDSNSEKVVQAALDQAAKGRTTLAIAHRLSTIQNADRIYFIKEGRVSEMGTHDQLIARKGDYYEYVQLQALSKRD
ncbi:ste6-like protein [Schizophyllum amplum]|uniref:Ste6-like protein n=1 Tax=Schizophyllum amplum TaxID=97359 RepID=A0A550CH54_9AGAR|nr:ste6-like protein [Auriculariopsis ampla]